MYKKIALFFVFTVSCACTPLSEIDHSVLFKKYADDYVSKDGSTIWIPKNMNARYIEHSDDAQTVLESCVQGKELGRKYTDNDIFKELPDGSRVYAFYHYYTYQVWDYIDVFDIKPHYDTVYSNIIMNYIVNKEGTITKCKYMRLKKYFNIHP